MLKSNFQKTCLILFSAGFLLIALAGFSLAQEEPKPLEIQYPDIPEAKTPTTIKDTFLTQYINYLFRFAIWIAGFLAFGSLIYGGVRYLTSAGSPTAMGDAQNQIFAGILGLIIIVSAYTILVNINPQLVVLKIDSKGAPAAGEIPGVYLCKTADLNAGSCIVYNMTSDTIDPDFDNNFTNVFFKNVDETTYGAVLHEDKGRRGECQVLTSDGSTNIKASSITVFRQGPGSGGGEGVTLYEAKEYNKECGAECHETCIDSNQGKRCGDGCVGLIGSGGKCWGPYTSITKTLPSPEMSNDDTRSIEINPSGKYLVVLSSKPNLGKCEVFTTSYDYLKGTYLGIKYIKSLIVLPIK